MPIWKTIPLSFPQKQKGIYQDIWQSLNLDPNFKVALGCFVGGGNSI